MRLRSLVFASCVLFTCAGISAQQQPAPTSQAQAVALATNALSALSGAHPISDVTLTGTGTRTAGSDVESGNVTLKALGPYESRLDLAVSGGTRSDIFNLSSSSAPVQPFWIGKDGTAHPIADHNTLAGAISYSPHSPFCPRPPIPISWSLNPRSRDTRRNICPAPSLHPSKPGRRCPRRSDVGAALRHRRLSGLILASPCRASF